MRSGGRGPLGAVFQHRGLGLCRNGTVSLASPHKLGLQTRTIGKGNPLPLSQARYMLYAP